MGWRGVGVRDWCVKDAWGDDGARGESRKVRGR